MPKSIFILLNFFCGKHVLHCIEVHRIGSTLHFFLWLFLNFICLICKIQYLFTISKAIGREKLLHCAEIIYIYFREIHIFCWRDRLLLLGLGHTLNCFELIFRWLQLNYFLRLRYGAKIGEINLLLWWRNYLLLFYRLNCIEKILHCVKILFTFSWLLLNFYLYLSLALCHRGL